VAKLQSNVRKQKQICDSVWVAALEGRAQKAAYSTLNVGCVIDGNSSRIITSVIKSMDAGGGASKTYLAIWIF
jgi:hypothetical protein